jgi:hypothetical protein
MEEAALEPGGDGEAYKGGFVHAPFPLEQHFCPMSLSRLRRWLAGLDRWGGCFCAGFHPPDIKKMNQRLLYA